MNKSLVALLLGGCIAFNAAGASEFSIQVLAEPGSAIWNEDVDAARTLSGSEPKVDTASRTITVDTDYTGIEAVRMALGGANILTSRQIELTIETFDVPAGKVPFNPQDWVDAKSPQQIWELRKTLPNNGRSTDVAHAIVLNNHPYMAKMKLGDIAIQPRIFKTQVMLEYSASLVSGPHTHDATKGATMAPIGRTLPILQYGDSKTDHFVLVTCEPVHVQFEGDSHWIVPVAPAGYSAGGRQAGDDMQPHHHFLLPLADLERIFADLEIDTSKPGFHDHPRFLAVEREDGEFFNTYAAFVHQRAYQPDYLARARAVVPTVARILYEQLVAEGRLGACVDLSMALARILERLGIWSYMVKGALTIEYPKSARLANTHFCPINEAGISGHVWVAAPPFRVIDLTIKRQPYASLRTPIYLPDFVLAEKGGACSPTVYDLCDPVDGQMPPSGFHFEVVPHLRPMLRMFPGLEVKHDQTQCRYFTCAPSASNEALEDINNQTWAGRSAAAIYHELVVPALDQAGVL